MKFRISSGFSQVKSRDGGVTDTAQAQNLDPLDVLQYY
jgi:hypothetical protein